MITLPTDENGNVPLRRKDQQEWADCMLEVLAMMDYVIQLEQSYTMQHPLRELGDFSGLTKERIRQIEMEGLKKIRKTMPKSEWDELRKAMLAFSKANDDKMVTFTSSEVGSLQSTPYEDPNGKTYA